jgi:TonB family protein
MNNAFAYSLQVLLLVAIGSALPWLVRMRAPRARLLYWHLLLAGCLLLPFAQPWKSAAANVIYEDGPIQRGVPVKLPARSSFPIETALKGVYLAGLTLRLGWLVLGFARLRRYRDRAEFLRLQSGAEVMISTEINSPVTFGVWRPVILLPPGFVKLEPTAREAVMLHELFHIERRDWTFSITEEIIRAVFWFHPAIWWLLGQIQLTREEVVDRAVVEVTKSREQYLEALLAVAKAKLQPDLALAPLFLRKRHLARRVAALLKEVSMSNKRIAATLVTAFSIALITARVAVWIFPLEASAQSPDTQMSMSVETGGLKLMHGGVPKYPSVEGDVVVQVSLNEKGEVTDAQVISGAPELRKAALADALEWHFVQDGSLPPTLQATIKFRLGNGGPSNAMHMVPQLPPGVSSLTLDQLTFSGLSPEMQQRLQSALPIHAGDTLDNEALKRLHESVSAVDEHLAIHIRTMSSRAITIDIGLNSGGGNVIPPPAPGEKRIRVGGTIQSAKLIDKATPSYPPLAKQARVQGTVRFNVLIAKDGRVQTLELVNGHPLLVPSATEAVSRWVYQPTLLNGEPVEVQTTIDVNFTLLQ